MCSAFSLAAKLAAVSYQTWSIPSNWLRLCTVAGPFPPKHKIDLNGPHATFAWQLVRNYARSAERHATTVLSVRKGQQVVVISDGQVTEGSMIIKQNVNKIRRISDQIIGGWAGASADGLTLFDLLEAKIEEHPGQLRRAAVELAKLWRQDRRLRQLEVCWAHPVPHFDICSPSKSLNGWQAELIVADSHTSMIIGGNGDVLEAYDGVLAVGSGSEYAEAASRALLDQPDMDALAIARKAMKIAADLDVYTNHTTNYELLEGSSPAAGGSPQK